MLFELKVQIDVRIWANAEGEIVLSEWLGQYGTCGAPGVADRDPGDCFAIVDGLDHAGLEALRRYDHGPRGAVGIDTILDADVPLRALVALLAAEAASCHEHDWPGQPLEDAWLAESWDVDRGCDRTDGRISYTDEGQALLYLYEKTVRDEIVRLRMSSQKEVKS